jgi:hypothetical protein
MNKTLVALALGFVLAMVLSAPSQAADPTKLTFRGAFPSRDKTQLALSAQLTSADGKPLGDQEVAFYQRVDFFGQRDAYIASGTTSSEGVATVAYSPVQTGKQTILVSFVGDGKYGDSRATGQIEVKDAAVLWEEPPLPLAPVSRYLPFVLGAFVLATWIVLLGIFLSATAGIRSAVGVRTAEQKEAAVHAHS